MESQERLRRKDTTKGPPLRVLSLDGGGVRGYSMLILLQELMYKTYNAAEGKPPKLDQIPKPCEYFDLIVGSGTGGLIAIMLGRLRLDVETCKEVYIRMTRRVFETDKTIAGIPYRSTLFKASKLEEAIQDCVAEHTLDEDEGNDGTSKGGVEMPISPVGSPADNIQRRQSYNSSIRSGVTGFTPLSPSSNMKFGPARWRGNPNASLYDTREHRTKTAVTAVYKGTRAGGRSALLRSYDSRAEPPPEFNCSIWQAGRATCAIGLAFKPIQIGQSVFHDEGAGAFNPTPQVIDECVLHEWPHREIGALVSIGTGRRPSGTGHRQSEWWEGFVGSTAGSFAEARRRLISKIEECEKIHKFVRDEYLAKRNVNPENYYRLNVEIGVGEFGMNEWSQLAKISTSTRMYLSQPETRVITQDAASKLGKIERMKRKAHAQTLVVGSIPNSGLVAGDSPRFTMPVELPGDDGAVFERASTGLRDMAYRRSNDGTDDKFPVIVEDTSPPQTVLLPAQRLSLDQNSRNSADMDISDTSIQPSPRRSNDDRETSSLHAPPLPPKTPLNISNQHSAYSVQNRTPIKRLPYPVDDDESPPEVDMGRKPTLQRQTR